MLSLYLLNGESKMPLHSIEFNFPIYIDGKEVRTCIHSRNRRMGEGFSRQARQIFAGIIVFISRKFNAAWRE